MKRLRHSQIPRLRGETWGTRFVAGLLLTMAAVGVRAQSSGPLLLSLAKKDMALAIIDPRTMQVLAKVPAGGNPHEVIASADGTHAWITNYGNGSLNTITVVDLRRRVVEKTIDLGPIRGPHGLAVAGGEVWFTAEREKLIGRIDPATETVDWLLGTGQTGTHMLWVAQDLSQIVTVNVGSGTMDLLERRTPGPLQAAGGPPSKTGATTTLGPSGPISPDWDQTIVKVGGLPEGFDVLTDAVGHAKTIWAANAKDGTVSVIDFPTKTVTATLDLQVPTANRLRFTPDGRLALISRERSGELTVVDVASQQVVKRVLIGTGAAGVLIAPDGLRAYVSCSPDDKVAVFDLRTMAVVGEIRPGNEPDGLAWVAGR